MSTSDVDALVAQMLGDTPDDALDRLVDVDESALCRALERAGRDGGAAKAGWWDAIAEFAEIAGRPPRDGARELDLAAFAELAGGAFETVSSLTACLGAFALPARHRWARDLAAHPHDAVALNAIDVLVDDGAVGAAELARLRRVGGPWRMFALELLLKVGEPGAVEQIVRFVSAREPTAWGVLDAVEKHARPADVALLQRLYEKRFFVSFVAPRAAGVAVALGDREALTWLRRHAESRKTDVRSVALAELLRVGEAADRERVQALVRANDGASFWVISRCGAVWDAETERFLRWCATSHADAGVRGAAVAAWEARAMLGLEPADVVRAALGDADEDVRLTAARVLAIARRRGLVS